MVFFDFIQMPLTLAVPYTIAFIALLAGSYTDFKTREVPDWANFGLIAAGFGINLLFSVIYWKFSFIVNSIIGFSIFFIIAYLMFRFGQWGGGDSKMLMGLGALVGISFFSGEFPFLASFLINALFIGALYGILWSFFLVAKSRKKFIKSFRKLNGSKKTVLAKRIGLALFFVLVLIALLVPGRSIRLLSLYLALVTALTFYLWLLVRAVEDSCMLKFVLPKQLTEGDWIAKDIWFKKIDKKSLLNYIKINNKKYVSEKKKSDLIILFLKEFNYKNIFSNLIKRKKKKIENSNLLSKEKIIENISQEIYCNSKNALVRLIRLIKYLFIFKNDFDFNLYKKNIEGLLTIKSKTRLEAYKKNLGIYNKKSDIEKFLRANYYFDYNLEYITGPKDLGIEKMQIIRLISIYKNKKILIKEGIPFVPSFFIAYVITLIFGNLAFLFFL